MKRVSSHVSLASEAEINLDLSRLIIDKPRFGLERKRSFDEQSWSELSHRQNDGFDSVLQSPAFPSGGFDSPFSMGTHFGGPHPLVNEAWEALRKSVVYFRGQPVGTIAAVDHASEEVLNYDQVFVRDFVPSALAFLMNNETDIVKNFLLKTLHLQSSEKMVDRFKLGAARDSVYYNFQGIYGYPIEIQALFYMALRCALQMLKPEGEGKEFIEKIGQRLHALTYHMRNYFWLDFHNLNNIYRYKTEEYSHTAVNKFNVIPDSIPDWVFDFMPCRGGYFLGNVSPAMMDFRWFALGNCIAIVSSLSTPEQSVAIMDLIEERWDELVGEMPLKICYPAIENHEWRIITGCDPKNTRWSYHNGGSWPVLLWLLTAACIKTGRPQMAKRAIELAESRLLKDGWPEYYDGKLGRFVGKQARKFQTWSIAGYLVARMMLEDPSTLMMISMEEDRPVKPTMRRSASWNA
nr:unnamed protein product [Digitaria exilis]